MASVCFWVGFSCYDSHAINLKDLNHIILQVYTSWCEISIYEIWCENIFIFPFKMLYFILSVPPSTSADNFVS